MHSLLQIIHEKALNNWYHFKNVASFYVLIVNISVFDKILAYLFQKGKKKREKEMGSQLCVPFAHNTICIHKLLLVII